MKLQKLGLIGAIILVMLFINGLIIALNTFEKEMKIVDWVITDFAESLPKRIGDIVKVIGLGLFLYVIEKFDLSIRTISKYL